MTLLRGWLVTKSINGMIALNQFTFFFFLIIGTSQANTTLIVNSGCGLSSAAKICDNLVLNGYSDWLLPSKYEHNQMYL
jgi:hypothetical protein